MKVAGIITEYNPFHNGHKYHIEETRRITGCDYVIAVMSGNFVQRGTPALMDKYSRTRMALANGVDLVIELPVCYATASAEYFATGAVSLLDKLGIVDTICFGSECGDIKLLTDTAKILLNQEDSWSTTLFSNIKEGMSYPAARLHAVTKSLEEKESRDYDHITKLLSEPNNILGLEYLKALLKISSSIKAVTIQRQVAHYHDKELSSSAVETSSTIISSATAIRRSLFDEDAIFSFDKIKDSIPMDVFELMSTNYYKSFPITEEDFGSIIKYKLLSSSKKECMDILDISSDLADRLSNLANLHLTMNELVKSIKTKNLTHSRINRALCHLLLNIKSEQLARYIDHGYTFYARVLGAKKEATHLLRKITDQTDFPVITKVSKAHKQLDPLAMEMFQQDIFATHLYHQIVYDKYKTMLPSEYRAGVQLL